VAVALGIRRHDRGRGDAGVGVDGGGGSGGHPVGASECKVTGSDMAMMVQHQSRQVMASIVMAFNESRCRGPSVHQRSHT
jgi:hypothetical protein